MILEKKVILEKQLKLLSSKQRIVFALDCAKNAIPNYERWVLGEGKKWGNSSVLWMAVDEIWKIFEGDKEKYDDELDQLEENVDNVTPHSEDFQDASGSGAMDAGIVVIYAIIVMKSGDN